MSTAEPEKALTYGNWRRPTSPGIKGFGLLGTGVMLLGLIVIIITVTVGGPIAAMIAAVPFILVMVLLSLKDKHGRNAGQRVATRAGWAAAKRSGSNVYRSGPLGQIPWGKYQLPGLSAKSELSEWRDSYGRPFALVRVPQTSHFTVVIESQPDGASLVDPAQVDQWVANWGGWLARLGNEPGLVAATVTIETAPDTGSRLRREVELHIAEKGHPIAHDMLRETVESYPSGSAEIRAWVAITFKGTNPGGKRRDAAEMARDLASRLPAMTSSLADTGAGVGHPVDAYDLCQIIRTAYDPAVATIFDEAHAAGEKVDLDWTDVGPVATDTAWGHYRHDDCLSVSWTMTQAPRGLSFSNCLAQLVNTHQDVDRKRVTLLYRPIPAGIASALVEADKRNAEFTVSGQTKVSARAIADVKSATATANEEARGAGLVNFGMIVTATVTSPDRMDAAKAAIDNLSASARIVLRPAFGGQDSAFAASLPLGLVLPDHLKVPAALRAAV